LMKRQVAEAWKNMKSKAGDTNEVPRIEEPCHCRHYGLPYFQNKSSKGKAEASQDHKAEGNWKRKAISLEPQLRSEPNLSSTS